MAARHPPACPRAFGPRLLSQAQVVQAVLPCPGLDDQDRMAERCRGAFVVAVPKVRTLVCRHLKDAPQPAAVELVEPQVLEAVVHLGASVAGDQSQAKRQAAFWAFGQREARVVKAL